VLGPSGPLSETASASAASPGALPLHKSAILVKQPRQRTLMKEQTPLRSLTSVPRNRISQIPWLLAASCFYRRAHSHPAIPSTQPGAAIDQRTFLCLLRMPILCLATATADPYASANCKVRDWRPGSRPGLSVSSISDEWTLAVRLSGLDAARGATVKWKRLAKRGTHAFAGPLNCSMSLKSRAVF